MTTTTSRYASLSPAAQRRIQNRRRATVARRQAAVLEARHAAAVEARIQEGASLLEWADRHVRLALAATDGVAARSWLAWAHSELARAVAVLGRRPVVQMAAWTLVQAQDAVAARW